MARIKRSNKQSGRKSTNKPTNNNSNLMNVKKVENRYGGANAVDLPISEGWHTVTQDIEDVESYIFNYLKDHKYDVIQLMIGTDSLRRTVKKGTHEVRLLSVICLRRVGNGVHVIKRRESHIIDRFVPTAEKLNMEVNKTYEMAMWLKEIGLKFEIHLDLNPNQCHESFNVYQHVHGWFESMGFTTQYKPDAAAAMACADYYL